MFKCTFNGNLGRDCELRQLPNGTPVSNFAVGVATGFGDNKATVWVDCAIFGKRAESLSQYLGKGQKVMISGNLSEQSWEKDGITHKKIKCAVDEVELMGGNQQPVQPVQQPADYAPPQQGSSDNADIPF